MTMEIYQEDAKKKVEELDVDEELRDVLLDYFLTIAKMNYHAISSLRKRVLPDVSLFIDYLARKKGAMLTLADLDLTKLKSHHIINYLKERTDSIETQRVINSFVSVFGRWLDREGYITKFAYAKIPKPDVPPSKARELEMGKPRTLDEIDKLFSVISLSTPRVPRERLPIYKYWGQLLLVSCLRPLHLHLLRVGDLETTEIAEDCFGDKYAVISCYNAVKREKEARGEMIKKKKPGEYFYLYKPLHTELQTFCMKRGWDSDDPLFPIPIRSLQNRAATIARMTVTNPERVEVKIIPDFVWYDLRNTWATVIYNAVAPKGPVALVNLCGWSSSEIAVDAYVGAMKSLEAVEMAQKYHIIIPKVYKEEVDRILAGKKIEVTPEDIEELNELRRQVAFLTKKYAEFEKRRKE